MSFNKLRKIDQSCKSDEEDYFKKSFPSDTDHNTKRSLGLNEGGSIELAFEWQTKRIETLAGRVENKLQALYQTR